MPYVSVWLPSSVCSSQAADRVISENNTDQQDSRPLYSNGRVRRMPLYHRTIFILPRTRGESHQKDFDLVEYQLDKS